MKDILKRHCAIFLLILLHAAGYSQTYDGSIIRVIDGDTFVFQTTDGAFTVRMYGIVAPERDQPFSSESTAFLSKYLYKKATTKISGVDRYGRRVGVLYIKHKDYADAEKYARKRGKGLWKSDDPVSPWNWRQDNEKYGGFFPVNTRQV